jgi:hypothetical protein
MKNKLLKIIPVVSIIIFCSLSTLGKNDLKASDITLEQIEVKHLASQEVLKKVAQHEIETSWINASIVSVEKNNLESKWLIIFKNEEITQKDKKLNISINSNGDIIESKLI